MSLLITFINELNGLGQKTDATPSGVQTPPMRLLKLDSPLSGDCNCNCDCDCQCKCGQDCDCKCDCDCQCKCDCNENSLAAQTVKAARGELLQSRFNAVMLVHRGESIERAAQAYEVDPDKLVLWASGFKVHGPRILQLDNPF